MLESVHLLAAGYCVQREALTLRGGNWARTRYPAGFALIRHARQGPILFDTGYSGHFFAATAKWPGSLYARATPVYLQEEQSACHQIAALGVAPRDVGHIFISHFHADHIAGLRDFPVARVWCSRAAWGSVRGIHGLSAVAKGFLPELMPPDIERRMTYVDDCLWVPLPSALTSLGRGHDLLGDGSMLAVDLPGHAVGQTGLFLSAAPVAPLLLVADAAWSRQAITTGTPPPWLSTAFLGEVRNYRDTFARLHAIQMANPALAIIPSHDISVARGPNAALPRESEIDVLQNQ